MGTAESDRRWRLLVRVRILFEWPGINLKKKVSLLNDASLLVVLRNDKPDTRAGMFAFINPFNVATPYDHRYVAWCYRRNKNLGRGWDRGGRFARATRQIQNSDQPAQT